MKFLHHFTYFVGCTVTFLCCTVVEITVLNSLLKTILPQSFSWVYYGLVLLLYCLVNPYIAWLVGGRISHRFFNESN